MKADLVRRILFANKGFNFIINTNEPKGRGINGVDYTTYYGVILTHRDIYGSWKDEGTITSTTIVKGISTMYNAILLYCYNNSSNDHPKYKYVLLDCDCITSIFIITKEDDTYYPVKIDKKLVKQFCFDSTAIDNLEYVEGE